MQLTHLPINSKWYIVSGFNLIEFQFKKSFFCAYHEIARLVTSRKMIRERGTSGFCFKATY